MKVDLSQLVLTGSGLVPAKMGSRFPYEYKFSVSGGKRQRWIQYHGSLAVAKRAARRVLSREFPGEQVKLYAVRRVRTGGSPWRPTIGKHNPAGRRMKYGGTVRIAGNLRSNPARKRG